MSHTQTIGAFTHTCFVLQSSFIVGYSITSLTMGYLVNHFQPFKLICVGLIIWSSAVLLCGLAPNFWVLLVARMVSGVGEASFQCIVPPYIDDMAPPSKRGLWLSLFYLNIPFGTAVGYGTCARRRARAAHSVNAMLRACACVWPNADEFMGDEDQPILPI